MLYGTAEDTGPAVSDHEIVREAVERWIACKDWQGVQDERSREDIKFANGDSRNAWQWPTKTYEQRTGESSNLPCLTINKTRTHNDIIINSMSENEFAPKIRPTAGKASYKSAQVHECIMRRIKNQSQWTAQKRKIAEQQVDGGIGYCILETRYVSNRSRNQDIFLVASRDPTGVYLDPWIREPDGRDANFGFVFERLPRKEFNRKYPKWKDKVGAAPIDNSFADWISDKEILLAKYYRKRQTPDTYVWYEDADGNEVEELASELKDEAGQKIYKALTKEIKDGTIKGGTRSVHNDEVEWFLIAGNVIVDRGDWAGKYIPICRCVGRELVVDSTLDRKGHTRPLIDAQRMLNYDSSMSVEDVAVQTRAPWLASVRAVEGQEGWKTANINDFAVLLYNDIDDEAPVEMQEIKPPQRIDRPQPSQAYMIGIQTAERWMMMVSGQYQESLGENAKQAALSGKAINERKEQGDTATYHFVEHMRDMERFIGVQLIDLIPKIYDTKRTLHVLDEQGEKFWIQIDPDQDEVIRELAHEKDEEEAVQLALNPKLGEYECVSDPGPDYATQRQEAWAAMSMILQANKEMAGVIGDLLFKYGDFPGAEDIMERLQKELKATKPYLFDDKLDPQMQALQQQNKNLVQLNAELMTKLADEKIKVRGRDEKRDIESFNADTKRLEAEIKAMKELLLTPQQKAQMEHDLTSAFHQHVYTTIEQANQANVSGESEQDGDDEPPMEGARKARDGHWYVPDKARGPNKYMRVMH